MKIKTLLLVVSLLVFDVIACAQTPKTITVTLPGGTFDVPITIVPAPPTYTNIVPTVFVQGTTTKAIITGTNLLGVAGFTCAPSCTGVTMTIDPAVPRTNTTMGVIITLSINAAINYGRCIIMDGKCLSPMGPVNFDIMTAFQPIKPPFEQ